MAEIILPPEEETPQEPELNIDKPTENSKVITIEFKAKKTNKVSTKDTNQQLYTTDTDAWFEFKETSLEGANGTYSVVFRNRHDGSIFQRTGDVVNGVAYYKIPHQEIRHAGAWRGQLVYTLENGDTTAREFGYDVKGHILDGKDVREIVVEDFETLMSQLNIMKDNAELELADLVNAAERNELERQQFYESLVEDIDELQTNYQELLDTGVLQTNINEKLEELEEEYAPRLNEVTAQLAQIAQNVKSFGAKGDGITDDTIAIQSAIDYCIANKYALKIPNGTYMIKATSADNTFPAGTLNGGVQIKGSLRLILDSQTVLKAISGDKVGYTIVGVTNAENVVIEGGKILGERTTHIGTSGSFGHGINIISSKNITVKNTVISDCWGDGITVDSSYTTGAVASENITIENVTCDNNRRLGLSILSSKNVKVLNSTFSNTNGTAPEYGIDIEPDHNANAKHISIINCTFQGNVKGGVVLGHGLGCEDVLISNNHFVETTGQGITITGTDTTLVRDININSNNFTVSTGQGISLGLVTNVSVCNNILKSLTQYSNDGIYVTRPTNATLDNNIIVDFGIGMVFINSSANDIRILGNALKYANTAIQFNTSVENVSIINNVISDTKLTSVFLRVKNSTVSGNRISNSQKEGFNCNIENTVISNNKFKNIGLSDSVNNSMISLYISENNFINGNYFESTTSQRAVWQTETPTSPSVISNNFARYTTNPFYVNAINIISNNFTG